jgi:hypothetical protein
MGNDLLWLTQHTEGLCFILSVLFLVIELFAPSALFLSLSLASFLCGIVVFQIPTMSFFLQASLFASLSLASLALWSRYRNLFDTENKTHSLNQKLSQFMGQTFILDTARINGRGRIKVGDGFWPVVGPDLPKGSVVKVVSVKNHVLQVIGEK